MLPRSIRGVSPGDGFHRFGRAPLEGMHTGGVWTDGTWAWKPLDGGNAHDGPHHPTLEAECLEEMAGLVGFPHNWRVEEQNGRRWLVRPICKVVGQDLPAAELGSEVGFRVELMLRELNAKGWELGDHVSLAWHPDYGYFILDLSCAARTYLTWHEDDEWRLWRWWEDNGWTGILKLRRRARSLVSGIGAFERRLPRGWRWVYASRVARQPFLPTIYIDAGEDAPAGVKAWIVTDGPLPHKWLDRHNLFLGWHPWRTPAREKA